MLIECPFCHARAQLPESKEGSKVRCGECGRIYGARPAGGRKGKQTNPVPFIVGGIVVVLGVVLFSVINKGGKKNTAPPVVVIEEPTRAPRGWEAPSVQAVLKLHKAANDDKRGILLASLDGPTVHAVRAEAAMAAAEEAAAEAGGDVAPVEGHLAKGWTELQQFERQEQLEAWVDEMLDTEAEDSIANWTPFDGEVWSEQGKVYTVRVDCTPADGGAESRMFEWVLVEENERFLATRWGRWIDPDSIKKSYGKRDKGYEKVTLSDGSVVHEREPEPLAHLEDTPQELRDEIDAMYANAINMSLTKEQTRAKARLVEIGKPAIPILLTGLYEIKLDSDENRRQAFQVVQVLRDITDQYFGYAPMTLEGGALGTTEERRQSSIKQWFAWWYRKAKRFDGPAEKVDALDEALGEMTPEEKAWLDRHKDR